jgi:hypothetical protein
MGHVRAERESTRGVNVQQRVARKTGAMMAGEEFGDTM